VLPFHNWCCIRLNLVPNLLNVTILSKVTLCQNLLVVFCLHTDHDLLHIWMLQRSLNLRDGNEWWLLSTASTRWFTIGPLANHNLLSVWCFSSRLHFWMWLLRSYIVFS
jgi:hypothetical protein